MAKLSDITKAKWREQTGETDEVLMSVKNGALACQKIAVGRPLSNSRMVARELLVNAQLDRLSTGPTRKATKAVGSLSEVSSWPGRVCFSWALTGGWVDSCFASPVL